MKKITVSDAVGTPGTGDVWEILVPDGHPMVGQQVTLYPDSGATTYNEGSLRFTSPGHKALTAELDALRTTLIDFKQNFDHSPKE